MPNPFFTLRPATPSDHPHLHAFDARLIGEAELPGASSADFAHFQAAFTTQALADPAARIVVATDAAAGAILGYVQMKPVRDDVLGRDVGHIGIIAVAASAGGKGIGHALMAAAEDWAKEMQFPALVLDVFASNRTARSFYAAQGFIEDSMRLRKVL